MEQTAKRQLSVRLTVFIAAVGTVFLLIGGAADADAPIPTVEYVVDAGDSLWSIAAAHAEPSSDVRSLISDIRKLSELSGSTIYPGQVLRIPGT